MDLFGILFFAYFVIGTLFIPVYDKFIKPEGVIIPNTQYLAMMLLWPVSLVVILINRLKK